MSIVDDIKTQIKQLQQKLVDIQEQCNHPLPARVTENKGSTGHWDDPEGTYWTVHLCTLCEKKWHTDQNWERTGDGRGMPSHNK